MPLAPPDSSTQTRRRGGFTFIEVMFAVMILGFGVIMIAAMLPVALRQTQIARDTVAGSAVVESGFHTMEAAFALRGGSNAYSVNATGRPLNPGTGFAEAYTYPSLESPYGTTPRPQLFNTTLGDRIAGNGTTAYIPFYYQAGDDAPRVTIVGVGVRNAATMSDPDAAAASFLRPGAFFTNEDNCPLPVTALMTDGSQPVGATGQREQVRPNTLALASRNGTTDPQLAQAAVEGAAVVFRDANGVLRAYRLGKAADDTGFLWDLAPGGDFTPGDVRLDTANAPLPVTAYLVGRMLKNPGDVWGATANPYVGPSQVTQVLESQSLR